MTTAEIVAYLCGADLAARRVPWRGFVLLPAKTLRGLLTDQELAARSHLGGDLWAHWVHRGWEEATAGAH